MRILFQGDSVTDAGRERRDYHQLGNGYPKYAAELIKQAFPEVEFEFINQGISGNRTGELFDRSSKDLIEFQPDIVSVLIGVNDVLHKYCWPENIKVPTTPQQTEANYRALLSEIKKRTNAKILMMAPFVLGGERYGVAIPDVRALQPMIKRLANEFADAFVPLFDHFDEAMVEHPDPLYFTADGVHPNEVGARFIAGYYAQAIKPLIQSLI